MRFSPFQPKYCRIAWSLAATLALSLIGLVCPHVEAQVPAPLPETPPALAALAENNDARSALWQEEMHNAAGAISQKTYALAEQNCKDALKIATLFGPADGRLTTNLVFLAGIYQFENQPNLAEQSLKSAVTSCEQGAGTNAPALVMPLEKLANFYYFARHRYDLAAPLCVRILQIVERASLPDNAEIIKRARAVAVVYRQLGDYAQAEPFYRQTLTAAENNNEALPECLLTTAGFYHDWKKYDQAESLCKQALALREKNAQTNPGSEAQMNLAVSLYGLAEIYRSWGKLDQAEQFYTRSKTITEKINGPDSSELARPLAGLAATFADQGKTNEAIALYQQAFALTENNLEPGDPVTEDVLHAYTDLLTQMNQTEQAKHLLQGYQWRVLMHGSAHAMRQNNFAEAEQFADQAVNLARTFSSIDARLSQSQVQQAEVYRTEGKGDLAEKTYQDAIASCEKAVGSQNPELILPLQSLANYYYYTKVQYDQVVSLYQRILNIVRHSPIHDPLETARWERNLADVYHMQKQNTQAEDLYQQALASAESATNSPAGEKVQYLQTLGDFYRITSQYDHAELQFKRALTIREQTMEANPNSDAQLDVAVCCDELGQTYLDWHKPDQAESFYRRSVAIVEKIDGPDSSELTPRLTGLAQALRAQKKFTEAEDLFKRDLQITQKGSGPNSPQVAEVLDQYAALLADMKKTEDAKNMLNWAESLRKENTQAN